jgi:asparagine synthase (glutamine-hydrolysing)
MAWCFGLYGFLDAAATTPDLVAQLAQMIAVSGVRIHANLDYALSQQSNHGISEGVGLFSIGALFPEFRLAEKWKETGRRVLETLGKELIYDDGAFSQHSANYHRLMLHDYLWALRLGEILGQPLSNQLKERVCHAGEFLYQLQDDNSGQVPNYGQNDGALLLPLSNCDYNNFRPVIQSAHYLAERTRCYSAGPWDEDLLWLFGPEALAAPVAKKVRADLKAEQAGCYTLRSEESFAFARCSTFRHRPSQADLLHLDLWWRGQNIALDAGTFSYNAPPPWDNPLARTAYHNTVGVDGLDQMDRAGRFLWLPWAKGRVRSSKRTANGQLAYWEGAHDGYERIDAPVKHRRAILQVSTYWLVIDQLTSASEHDYRLHWLLLDAPYEFNDKDLQLRLETSEGSYYVQVLASPSKSEWSLLRADEAGPRGWHAPCYNYREPALSLAVSARESTMRFCTLFGPQPYSLSLTERAVQLKTHTWQASIEFGSNDPQYSLITSVCLGGGLTDQLEIS